MLIFFLHSNINEYLIVIIGNIFDYLILPTSFPTFTMLIQVYLYPVHPSSLLGCIFRKNSGGILYILILSCRAQRNYVSLSHQKTEKEQKVTPE